MAEPTDVQHLVKQLMAGASPTENRALLDALMSGQVSSIFEKLKRDQAPTLSEMITTVGVTRVKESSGDRRRPVDRHPGRAGRARQEQAVGSRRTPTRRAINTGCGSTARRPATDPKRH